MIDINEHRHVKLKQFQSHRSYHRSYHRNYILINGYLLEGKETSMNTATIVDIK